MNEIQLQYVENVITRKKRGVHQHLTFFVIVENLSYHKQIDVLWAGEDGVWHTLPARFHSRLAPNRAECWQAHAQFQLSVASQSLPGNVTFSLRYRAEEVEYWDNNKGFNYPVRPTLELIYPSIAQYRSSTSATICLNTVNTISTLTDEGDSRLWPKLNRP